MLAPHPDRNGKTGLQEVTDVQPLLFFESVMICLHINLSPSLNLLECLCIKGFEHGRDDGRDEGSDEGSDGFSKMPLNKGAPMP